MVGGIWFCNWLAWFFVFWWLRIYFHSPILSLLLLILLLVGFVGFWLAWLFNLLWLWFLDWIWFILNLGFINDGFINDFVVVLSVPIWCGRLFIIILLLKFVLLALLLQLINLHLYLDWMAWCEALLTLLCVKAVLYEKALYCVILPWGVILTIEVC